MSAGPTIAKLEGLLARIRERTGSRGMQPAPAPPKHVAPSPPARLELTAPDEGDDDQPTLPPPAPGVGPGPLEVTSAPLDIEVTVEATVEHVESSPEEPEEAPISSRRPVAPSPVPEERLEQMAFGADEPRPPLHTPPPESGRMPSAPAQFEAEMPSQRIERELVPEVTRGQLVETLVPDVQGTVRPFAPSTFRELLDASLSL